MVDALAEALLQELPDREAQTRAVNVLSAFAALTESDADVRALFIHARESQDPGMRFLRERLFKTAEPAAANALLALARHGLMDRVGAFVQRVRERREAGGNGKEVRIESAAPLHEEERERIRRALEKRWGMPVSLAEKTDASLIGGFRLRSGDWQFDASVKGKITSLAKKLTANV